MCPDCLSRRNFQWPSACARQAPARAAPARKARSRSLRHRPRAWRRRPAGTAQLGGGGGLATRSGSRSRRTGPLRSCLNRSLGPVSLSCLFSRVSKAAGQPLSALAIRRPENPRRLLRGFGRFWAICLGRPGRAPAYRLLCGRTARRSPALGGSFLPFPPTARTFLRALAADRSLR